MVVYLRNHGKNFALRLIRRIVMKMPINRVFIIAEDKSEKFKNEKRSSKLDEILRKAKMIKLKNVGEQNEDTTKSYTNDSW